MISLCVVGLTAGQLFEPANQEVIVTNVVTALQPSIAEAVANALRNLGGASFSASSAGFAGGNSNFGSSTGFESSANFGSSAGYGSSAGAKVGSSAGAKVGSSFGSGATGAVEEATTRPEYNFEFKVADDEEQTYITHNEARDGDDVTGSYSYVDPNGSLITVNYRAGAMGYTQTVDTKEGAVQIRARPAARAPVQAAVSAVQAPRPLAARPQAVIEQVDLRIENSASSSAGLDESALIAQIISALQPSISAAVNSAVSSQQTVRISGAQTGFGAGAGFGAAETGFGAGASQTSFAGGDRLSPLFGLGR